MHLINYFDFDKFFDPTIIKCCYDKAIYQKQFIDRLWIEKPSIDNNKQSISISQVFIIFLMKQPTSNIIYFVLIHAVFWPADLIKRFKQVQEIINMWTTVDLYNQYFSNDQFSIVNFGVINFECGLVLEQLSSEGQK